MRALAPLALEGGSVPPSSFLESAGWDTGRRAGDALNGLVQLKSSAALADVFHAQSQKLAQVVEVAKLRAIEAEKEVKELIDMNKDDPDALYWQIASGPGFGYPEKKKSFGGGAKGALGGLGSMASGLGGLGGKKKKGLAGAASLAGGGGGEGEDDLSVDLKGARIAEALGEEVQKTRKALQDAHQLMHLVANVDRSLHVAWRAAAAHLRYPGQPVDPLPDFHPRPRTVSRPADLAPAWMDFLYASSQGADPYRLPDETAPFATREVHNPFGSPPLAAGWTPSMVPTEAPKPIAAGKRGIPGRSGHASAGAGSGAAGLAALL
eukprot:TRINITY_DN70807_c0_g1_i1.p1 TRINITY_DN70807_c0_g1~~TRINITY_DN70807_c0_g1_i1.p1  ORF type:complete len:322 (-),score=84.82 TRINITY_DN70807_c0_g1_i1:121-1086(-)